MKGCLKPLALIIAILFLALTAAAVSAPKTGVVRRGQVAPQTTRGIAAATRRAEIITVTPVAPIGIIAAAATRAPTATPLPTNTPTNTPLPTATPVPTNTPLPTATPIPVTGVTFDQVCDVDEGDMTDPQLDMHAGKYVTESFTGWRGWVYDVVDNGSGYDLQIAMRERGWFLWARNIVVEDIPDDLAFRLNVEQEIQFDGTVKEVDHTFNTMCNPITVENFTLH